MNTKVIKKSWFKCVALWNNTVIFCLLLIIWLLVLTPTAIVKKLFQKKFQLKEKNKNSFLKKSTSVLPDHFKQPF